MSIRTNAMELTAMSIAAAIVSTSAVGDLPSVGSGAIVAHFVAQPDHLTIDTHSNVIAWRAANDPSIVLNSAGDGDASRIRYDHSQLHGHGAIVVDPHHDHEGEVRYLSGSLGGLTLEDTTIFWLGYYAPGRNGAPTSGGQYAYSFGLPGSDGSQLDHQLDGCYIEFYGGQGTQTGQPIGYLNNAYSVWTTEYHAPGTQIGHRARANGQALDVPANTSGYSAGGSGADDLMLFCWQNSSGQGTAPNFVGNMAELIIYQGVLSGDDIAAVEAYLSAKLTTDPPRPPVKTTYEVTLTGDNPHGGPVAYGLAPHGDSQLGGIGRFTFDPVHETVDWEVTLTNERFKVTQAHFYSLDAKSNGDSVFCWGGRWSSDHFLHGHGFHVSTCTLQSVFNDPSSWVFMVHTEGGHFALDENGDLIPYHAPTHEVSVTGQLETGDRYNNRVGRKLTNRLLRERNTESGTDEEILTVYPSLAHFDREHTAPFPDASGNMWIEYSDATGGYVPSAYGASRGLLQGDIDTTEYLFYRYDDQGPSWDYGGPEGAAAGILVPVESHGGGPGHGGGPHGGGGGASPIAPARSCRADVNDDGHIDAVDVAAVLNAWGTTDPSVDPTADGIVDIDDLFVVLSNWGSCD